MADITWSIGRLISETKEAYTRQHLALMSRNGKIPGAFKEGKTWGFTVSPKLRQWVKEAMQKRQPVAKARKASRVPADAILKTVEVARLAGVSTRHAERLARTDLKRWRYQTSGKHNRFLDTPELREWCIQKKRQTRKWQHIRLAGNFQLGGGPSPYAYYELLTEEITNLIRLHPNVEIPRKPELEAAIVKLHSALMSQPSPSGSRSRLSPA